MRDSAGQSLRSQCPFLTAGYIMGVYFLPWDSPTHTESKPLHAGLMQCSGLLESRRIAWQYCSTSSPAHSPSSHNQPRPRSRIYSVWCHLPGRQQHRFSQSRGHLQCYAQAPNTKEREAESDLYTNGHSQNGHSQKGSQSNGSSPQNGRGSAPENGKVETMKGQGDVEKSKSIKGTLDHLLETSRQVQ